MAVADNDVTFVARGTHFDAIREHGLQVNSVAGNMHVAPAKVVQDSSDAAVPQVVLFTTKMGDTQTAAQQLRPIVREGMTIISFQNGVDGPEIIQPGLRGVNVVPGVARIGSRIARPGVIEHMSPFARIEFGEASGGNSGKLERFRTICEAASIDAVLSNAYSSKRLGR